MRNVSPESSLQKTVTPPCWRSLSVAGLFVHDLSLSLFFLTCPSVAGLGEEAHVG